MPTVEYYTLLEKLADERQNQMIWRWRVSQAIEELRSALSAFFGVEYLSYNDGRYRYVELFTSKFTPFHISSNEAIEYIQEIPTVSINIVVALELDNGLSPCICPIQVRLTHKRIEYRINKDGGRWTSDLKVTLKWIYQTLRDNISRSVFLSNSNSLSFITKSMHKNTFPLGPLFQN